MPEAQNAPEVIVRTRNLQKIYRDFWGRQKVRALKSLDLEIHRGEVFGLLGPNGSGKTTTIKLLLGLLFPTEGEVTVFGKPATDVAKNARIGYLPEESYLYRFLNAEETLDFYGRLFDISTEQRRQRTDELIRMVGLNWARHRQLKEYSKGMARRIGVAQSLINDPELVILDEPTTGLDPIGTREMKDLIINLRDEHGKTVKQMVNEKLSPPPMSIIFAVLALDPIFFSLSLKSFREPIWKIDLFSNKYLLLSMSLSLILLLGALSFEPLRTLLRLTPLSFGQMGLLLGVGLFNLFLIETAKYFLFVRPSR